MGGDLRVRPVSGALCEQPPRALPRRRPVRSTRPERSPGRIADARAARLRVDLVGWVERSETYRMRHDAGSNLVRPRSGALAVGLAPLDPPYKFMSLATGREWRPGTTATIAARLPAPPSPAGNPGAASPL